MVPDIALMLSCMGAGAIASLPMCCDPVAFELAAVVVVVVVWGAMASGCICPDWGAVD
jgi:hypothetical protein